MRIIVVALLSLLATGCGKGYRFHFVPTVEVMATNDCLGSTIQINSVLGDTAKFEYGELVVVTLERYLGRDRTMVLTARGWNYAGEYLGSTSRSFSTSQRGSRERPWSIRNLSGGLGCERPARRSRRDT